MATDAMELTNFHLRKAQKQALKALAKERGSNLAEEIRSAVDSYLSGVTLSELELLDAATRQAQAAIGEMNALLGETNRRADRIFAELAKLRRASAGSAK